MFQREAQGFGLISQAFPSLTGADLMSAVLADAWPSEATQKAIQSFSTSRNIVSRDAVEVLRREDDHGLSGAVVMAAWVVLAGPAVTTNYGGYGIRDGVLALAALRSRLQVLQAPTHEVRIAMDWLLDFYADVLDGHVCHGFTNWHRLSHRGCVAYLEHAADPVAAASGIQRHIEEPLGTEREDEYARGGAVQCLQRLEVRIRSQTGASMGKESSKELRRRQVLHLLEGDQSPAAQVALDCLLSDPEWAGLWPPD